MCGSLRANRLLLRGTEWVALDPTTPGVPLPVSSPGASEEAGAG